MLSRIALCACLFLLPASLLRADPPSVAYIFPAGGQRGTTTEFEVGGFNLHESAGFRMRGEGVDAVERINLTDTLFFEGPVIPQPPSQRKENYPRDYSGRVKIAADAPLGNRLWRVTTSQGITAAMKFVVGDLPEIVEQEIDGRPLPTEVALPVTINGRIFPREDVDIWTFRATAGRAVTCEVNAARIGSPLDSRLVVYDPAGNRIAENVDGIGTDSRLRFTPPVDGLYEVHIHDIAFGGLQHYVYRLTVTDGPVVDSVFPLGGRRGSTVELELSGADLPRATLSLTLPDGGEEMFHYHPQFAGGTDWPAVSPGPGSIRLALDDLPEVIEPQARGGQPPAVAPPAICNGRIAEPGEADRWAFEAKKGEQYVFDLHASRLGSPLDGVLTLLDSDGRQLEINDDRNKGKTDARLAFKIPADGRYVLQVADRLPTRGGPAFAYRLKMVRVEPEAAGFRLSLPTDAVTLERGKEIKLKLAVERLGGFKEEIALSIDNLPSGVTLAPAKVGKGKKNVQLTLKADESAAIATTGLNVLGTAMLDGREVRRAAQFDRGDDRPPTDVLLLRVAVPTPFKVVGLFETKYAARGTVYSRHYSIERGGYEGPITIRMADIQARHLQGVTGPVMTVPAGESEFDYPITLPPWMEVGRTSRTCVMAVADVTDRQGKTHTVCYSSTAQNDQIIVLVDPGRLNVRVVQQSIRARRGGSVRVPFQIERASDLHGAVRLELMIPRHIQGVSAAAASVAAGETEGELTLNFDEGPAGPFNMPLTVRARVQDEQGQPVTAEADLIVVPADN